MAYTLGALGGIVVGLTNASAGVAYLIGFGLCVVGMVYLFGPERFQHWREHHGRTIKRL